ncbi:hypothetical protein PTTG_09228, partial [Puccinia triticina 1-1 BBBD Race 1]
MVEHLEGKDAESQAISDLAIVAFWGLARLAELTYDKQCGTLDQSTSLLTSDVQASSTNSVLLILRDTKTSAPGETQCIVLNGQPNKLCPVRAVLRRLKEADGAVTSLFGYHLDGARQHLTRGRVTRVAHAIWELGGFHGITGHSFRVGGASLRFALGISAEEICTIGRWKSNAYLLYIREYS